MEKTMSRTMIALASGVASSPNVKEFRLIGSGPHDNKR